MNLLAYPLIALLIAVQAQGCLMKKFIPYAQVRACRSVLKTSEAADSLRWQLVVLSSAKCGFCLRAKKDIQKHHMPSLAKVTFLEHDMTTEEYEDFLKEGWYQNCEVIDADRCGSSQKFFPVYQTSNQKPVYVEKGYDNLTVSNIKSVTQKGHPSATHKEMRF